MSLLLDALSQKNLSRPPIWLMRQAGRYMPDYQKIRAKYGLNEMFREKDLMIKTTMLPIDLLGVDGAILFTDILTVLFGLGKNWRLEEGLGPVVETIHQVDELTKVDAEEAYGSITEAIEELKKQLRCPLIGFAGGPFTIAAYLLEGKLSKDLHVIKKRIYEDPSHLHQILDKITEATIDYLHLQIKSGVDILQIFDSWAGLLSPSAFKDFSVKYLKKISDSLPPTIPVILFTRGSTWYAQDLSSLNPRAISFDWHRQMGEIAKDIPEHISLQGNLDPCVLLGSWESIKKEVDLLLHSMKGSPRYIFNLGHGVLPQTPFKNVKLLVDYVKSF